MKITIRYQTNMSPPAQHRVRSQRPHRGERPTGEDSSNHARQSGWGP